MKRIFILAALLAASFPWVSLAQGTFRVRFDQATYSVTPGGTVSVGVVIDPTPPQGLFSFGIKVAYDEIMARVANAAAIVVPPPMDFNGVAGPGALRAIENGAAGVKGTVDFFLSPAQPYLGATLATISITDVSGIPGTSYPIRLDVFGTVGPNETVFVSGVGTSRESLAPRIRFVWTSLGPLGRTRRSLSVE